LLVLTAQDAVDAKVQALRAGADDYVTKPFAFEELLARVEALSRRPRALAKPTLQVGDLLLDQDTHEVRRAGVLIELTPKEYAVLEYLMRHAGRVMSRTLNHRIRLGLSLRPRHEHRRRRHQSSAQEARRGLRQEDDYDGARRRVRGEGVRTLNSELRTANCELNRELNREQRPKTRAARG
jgi:FixJ family two-component response regulator